MAWHLLITGPNYRLMFFTSPLWSGSRRHTEIMLQTICSHTLSSQKHLLVSPYHTGNEGLVPLPLSLSPLFLHVLRLRVVSSAWHDVPLFWGSSPPSSFQQMPSCPRLGGWCSLSNPMESLQHEGFHQENMKFFEIPIYRDKCQISFPESYTLPPTMCEKACFLSSLSALDSETLNIFWPIFLQKQNIALQFFFFHLLNQE